MLRCRKTMTRSELDHIEADGSVVKSTRVSEGVAIMWAELNAGPSPNAVEVAADHGVAVDEIKRTGTKACYRVEI